MFKYVLSFLNRTMSYRGLKDNIIVVTRLYPNMYYFIFFQHKYGSNDKVP